jgi:hypothetical protein
MYLIARFSAVALFASILIATHPDIADAQRGVAPRHPPHPQRAVVVRGHVFVGGYFYDPVFGPYPWWPRAAYPYWYFPIYDNRADVRFRVEPEEAEEAAVYVDGFYAGIVDDFNGVFEALPLTPGGHVIVLYLEGYRTARHNIYLRPASGFKLRATMERLPVGVTSEPPALAPPVPAPPAGTYRTPATGARSLPESAFRPAEAAGFGTLDLYVQPATADVTIDGQRWMSSEEGHFMVQMPAGRHHVDVSKPGYRHFTSNIDIRENEVMPVNVSLLTIP